MPESPYPMIPIPEAIDIILREVKSLSPVDAAFSDALGLVLADDVFAADPLPPFPASVVDGYALIAADTDSRRIIGDQTAGYVADLQVQSGQAARVTTGAPIPAGADAVVMVEDTVERDGWLELTAPVASGDNIRQIGVDIAAGQRVLAAGTVLGPPEIGLLATIGRVTVRVYPRPKIGVMSTGDELVSPEQKPEAGQIRDANRFALMGVIKQAGGIPLDLGIVPDEPDGLAQTIQRGLAEADALLTSGGVSMGQLDLVKPYLAKHGTLFFGRVNTKPGKPTTFGILKGNPFFAMPGNPVSALVSFEIFVRPALLKMAGHSNLSRPRQQVILSHKVRHSPARTEFQRATITRQPDGSYTATTTGAQASSRLLSLLGANALIVLPHGQGDFPAGSVVEAVILSNE